MTRRPSSSSIRSLVVAAVIVGCDRPPDGPLVARAELGVVFGDQIQARSEIPFELDPAKQTLAVRIDFTRPLTRDVRVVWTIEPPPGPVRRAAPEPVPAPSANATPPAAMHSRGGEASARAGEARFEATFRLEPGDPLGTWNVRALVEGRPVLDRPFSVFDPATRARATPQDGGS